ncbi:MAG: DUF4272 domain-containing protein [Flavobacteriales bacterium]|nr:DUF4272 domain-containing protein [Flavobacteriales bacterium]
MVELTERQISRKQNSIDFCNQKGIPTIDHLPAIEDDLEVEIRSKE